MFNSLEERAAFSVAVVASDVGLAVDDPVVVVQLDAVAVRSKDRRLALKFVILQKEKIILKLSSKFHPFLVCCSETKN